MSTKDNLQAAFAGESQANRKYQAFARRADKESFVQVAKLFRAAAESETIHANNHMRAMDSVKSTAENLQSAITGEETEFKQMYPKFIEEAQSEGANAALMSFKNAMAVEQVHYSLYIEALKKINQGEDMQPAKIYVCRVCGHTDVGELPDKCPVCNASADKYFEVK
ncbi:MAG: rubrerythrin family protein [Anaerohalosphaera sp.]|nr:rubrerythrin family protein [Anaerohalosphaera sp.]